MGRPVLAISRTSLQALRAHPRVVSRNSIRYATGLGGHTSESFPRVAQLSIWQSIVPKFLRERRKGSQQHAATERDKRKDWNPYTFFIVIFLLIGSNAINLIALRNEFATFSRQADAKIALLKEAIERVQAGEDVDVKGLLGTGDPEQEIEWEAVLREIEAENEAPSTSGKEPQSRRIESEADKASSEESQTQFSATTGGMETPDNMAVSGKPKTKRSPNFY